MLSTPFARSSSGDYANTQSQLFETASETIYLRDYCSELLVSCLRPDTGLRAFARTAEREHQLLKTIARRPDSKLTLAYNGEGIIVGQVTLVPTSDWWENLPNTCEIAVEVSATRRRRGLARQLLGLALEHDWLEDSIIIGMGLSWHWDIEGSGLTRFGYRTMIEQLFAYHGFAEYLTAEGNISMDPANIFLGRLGRRVDNDTMNLFFQRLLQSDTLPGL
jgi:hypothetical protein